jgi:O-antigen/teichoic acid export membrane protein
VRPVDFLRRFRRLGTAAGLYTISNGLNASVPLLLLPLLTRRLSPSEYGQVAMFELLVALVIPFVGVNLQGAVTRRYYDRDQVDFPAFVGTCVLLLVASTGFVAATLAVAAPGIERLTGFPRVWLVAVIVGAAGQFLVLLVLGVWQAREQPIRYGGFRLAQTVANLTLSVVLVVQLGLGWYGRVIAQAGTAVLFGGAGVWWLWREGFLQLRWVTDYARRGLRFGIPLIPHILGYWLIGMVDRVLIGRFLGPDAVGRYTAAYQIGLSIALLQNSFNQAWTPWLYDHLRRNQEADLRLIVRFTYGYFGVMLAMAACLAIGAPFIGRLLLGPSFQAGVPLIGLIGLGYAFQGMYKMVTNYIFYAERTDLLAAVSLLAGLAAVAMDYVLIQRLGIKGAAVASCIAFLLSFLGTWFVAARVHPMPWAPRSTAPASAS